VRLCVTHLQQSYIPDARLSPGHGVFAVGLGAEHLRPNQPKWALPGMWSRPFWIAVALLACLPLSTVHAQHASDDLLATANDAFGLTLGLESIGLYGPALVRGFNPQTAGNVRIDGLYFDQQGALSNRVVEGSTIRIGVSEIGYAFPAPTGIVDYDLRDPGNGTPSAAVVASAGPFEAGFPSVGKVHFRGFQNISSSGLSSLRTRTTSLIQHITTGE
jgi:hypothetical protein